MGLKGHETLENVHLQREAKRPIRATDLKLSIIPTVSYACFFIHDFCEQNKVYIDESQYKNKLTLKKLNEELYKNMPEPIYSYDGGEGKCYKIL